MADKIAKPFPDVTIEFDDAKHAYVWKEKDLPIPGVTTILSTINKPALVQWAANEASFFVRDNYREGMSGAEMASLCEEARTSHRKTASKAANIGTEVHSYAERFLKAVMLGRSTAEVQWPEDEQAANGCRAFAEWAVECNIEPVALERIIFSKKHYYCGTCDFFGYVDGELVTADFKTSKGLYPEMALQVGGAYTMALEEELDITIDKSLVILLDKESGTPKVYTIPRSERLMDAFVYASRLHRDMKHVEEMTNAIRKKV